MPITVITGPPCSGKTTYVRSHAQPGDIIIDFDTLAQALGSPTPHQHSQATRHVTIMARRAAIAAALSVAHTTHVWIVDCTINPHRATLYRRHHAQVVTLAASADELHARAGRERPPLWHQLIDAWRPGPASAGTDSRDW